MGGVQCPQARVLCAGWCLSAVAAARMLQPSWDLYGTHGRHTAGLLACWVAASAGVMMPGTPARSAEAGHLRQLPLGVGCSGANQLPMGPTTQERRLSSSARWCAAHVSWMLAWRNAADRVYCYRRHMGISSARTSTSSTAELGPCAGSSTSHSSCSWGRTVQTSGLRLPVSCQGTQQMCMEESYQLLPAGPDDTQCSLKPERGLQCTWHNLCVGTTGLCCHTLLPGTGNLTCMLHAPCVASKVVCACLMGGHQTVGKLTQQQDLCMNHGPLQQAGRSRASANALKRLVWPPCVPGSVRHVPEARNRCES
jgi:hypothetical protein